MGLPALEDNEEEDTVEQKVVEQKSEQSLEDIVLQGLKNIREKEGEKERKKKVREWDLGKDGVPDRMPSYAPKMGERKILSQEEWVKERRTLRPSEFAPPSFYDKT